jgi:methionine synthase I (cobalamin-dependent)
MTFGEDGTVMSGQEPATVARAMRELGADVVGVNCALGPASTLEVIEAMHHGLTDADLLAAQPNAGLPKRIGNRFCICPPPSILLNIPIGSYMLEYNCSVGAAALLRGISLR